MSDPIQSVAGVSGPAGAVELARRLRELRDSAGAGGSSGTLGVQQGQGDHARRYGIDVGAEDRSSFAETLRRAINETSAAQDRSSVAIERFLRGDPVELHEVMAAAQEASIALEMLVELRNKLTDTYRTLVTMQS